MKKITILLFSIVAAGLLAGCGKQKPLTEEEAFRISEYAADMLLKYDANYKNLLWEEEKTEEPVDTSEVPVKAEKEETTEKKPEAEKQEVNKPEDKEDAEKQEEETEVKADLATALGLDSISVTYKGVSFVKLFPADAKQGYSIRSGDGKKLLVLSLAVTNTSTEPVEVDVLSGMPSFRIQYNGEEVVSKMTITLEDFSTMMETVPAGATVERVLLGEVADSFEENLNTLSLITRFNDKVFVTEFK